jgi:4-carboxymuconolactone decarboxylase
MTTESTSRQRYPDTMQNVSMPQLDHPVPDSPLDGATRALVRLAAGAAGGTEAELRSVLAIAIRDCPSIWVEEVILQTYLFAGFPRALNAAREWRRLQGSSADARAGADDATDYSQADEWRRRGEVTCATVYGPAYERLRDNIAALHPALDAWMIVEGYGKVLSRPGLDLPRRELCIVAACAHTAQDRQLHSHLHGALNAGATAASVSATFDALEDILAPDALRSSRLLWARVRTQHA